MKINYKKLVDMDKVKFAVSFILPDGNYRIYTNITFDKYCELVDAIEDDKKWWEPYYCDDSNKITYVNLFQYVEVFISLDKNKKATENKKEEK